MIQYVKSSPWRQKGLTGYGFKYIDRPFCLRTDEMYFYNHSNGGVPSQLAAFVEWKLPLYEWL